MTTNNEWLARITLHVGYAEVETAGQSGYLRKLVSIESVAAAFANVKISTGILPPNTMAYEQDGSVVKVSVYIPPQKYRLLTPARTYHLPMPAFMLTGREKAYVLYAIPGGAYPTGDETLCYPPLPNIMNGGNVCAGNVPFPNCTPQTIMKTWDLIVGSYFTPHAINGRCKSYKNIFDLWDALDGAEVFPDEELAPMKREASSLATAAEEGLDDDDGLGDEEELEEEEGEEVVV